MVGGTVDGMTTPATEERRRFADELASVGPDATTLCEGWTARDLAAHVVLRERRPDAAVGVIASFLSGYTDKVQDKIAAGDWDELVETVRSGPPKLSPTRIDAVDRFVNTTEFFVHLEDVRRAQLDWEPRDLDDDLEDDLEGALKRMSKMFLRKAPAGVVLHVLDDDDDDEPEVEERIVAKKAGEGEATVTVSGPVGELIMWIFGRQAHARVSFDGPAEAVEALQNTTFGI